MSTAESRILDRSVDRFYVGYLKDALSVIERALQALEAGDSSDPSIFRAEVVAHKIKGNAALYDVPTLGETAKQLESLLKTRGASGAIIESMNDFADAMSDIIDISRRNEAGAELETVSEEVPEGPAAVRSGEVPIEPLPHSSGVAGRRILLVFENPWFADSLSQYLGGAVVHKSRSCGEAIHWLTKNVPDIIICESDLPDTPGIEFMEFMRGNKRFQKVPFLIAFPGNASFDEISEAIASGASAFIENVGNIQKLADQIQELLASDRQLVLIIDDDEPVRDMLQHTFEAAGYAVDTASDGIDALIKIRERNPDAIILDRIMPRMDGDATLRELQATVNLGAVPVIMLTAMDNVGEASKWLMRGASEFIAKPFDPEEVLARVSKLLKRRKVARS